MIKKLDALLALTRASRMAVVYSLPGMDNIQVQKNLVYRGDGRTSCKLDVYHPANDEAKSLNPTVIIVHGGAKAFSHLKDTRPFVSWGQLFAAAGIAAIVFNWDCPDAQQLVALMDYVREHAVQLNVDQDRLGILVFSGGVQVVVPTVLKGTLGDIRCLVAYYGNLKSVPAQFEDQTTLRRVPMLIVKAAQDEFMPADSSDRFVEWAQAAGAEVQQLTHSTGGHGFDFRNNDAQSHEIIKRTIEFVKESYVAPAK